MAPREVIHNFPDSSIAYDFDSSVSGGIAFHDGTTAMNALVEDGDDNMSDDDDGPGFHASIQSLTTGDSGVTVSTEDVVMTSLGSNGSNEQLTVFPDSGVEGGGTSLTAWHGLPSVPATFTDLPTIRETTPALDHTGTIALDPLSVDATDIQQEPWKYAGSSQNGQLSIASSPALIDGHESRRAQVMNQYNQFFNHIRSVSMGSSIAHSNQDVSMSSPWEFSSSSPDSSPHTSPDVHDGNLNKSIASPLPRSPFHSSETVGPTTSSSLFDEETHTSSVPEMDTTQESTNEESDFSPIESPPRRRGYHILLNSNTVAARNRPPLNMTENIPHDRASSYRAPTSKFVEDTQEEANLSPIRRPMPNAIEIPPMDHPAMSSTINSRGASNLNHEVPMMTTPLILSRRVSAGSASSASSCSHRSLQWNGAFDFDSPSNDSHSFSSPASVSDPRCNLNKVSSFSQQCRNVDSPLNRTNLFFDPHVTTVSDLKNYAERGLVVLVLQSLNTPRLKTLGTRMLADYAKMPQRRVAVASNRRILEFCRSIMVELPSSDDMGVEWPAREYAVETIRSLTATEESDQYLMRCPDLLQALAIVSCGGPFVDRSQISGNAACLSRTSRVSEYDVHHDPDDRRSHGTYLSFSTSPSLGVDGFSRITTNSKMGLVSGKARLHACIALMNLSCGKSNKVEIASLPEVLGAMRDVMVSDSQEFFPPTSSPIASSITSTTSSQVSEEARLKAVTCIKNLSNADANDGALLGMSGLVEALGYAAVKSCSEVSGATVCTTNACLALMNLSIAKANKHEVFRTPGVMEALMAVVIRTSPRILDGGEVKNPQNCEARIKACSALSNLAIGYDNKVPMFEYPGFVKSILHVIDTDDGEARTKACSILWSFAAEMKNQVPVSSTIMLFFVSRTITVSSDANDHTFYILQVVQRGDILPTLVRIADEDQSTEARFKCVAALTLLAESLENAVPLLESGAIHPLMDILHEAGPDPTQWKGQTASWCVGFFMNIAQSDEAVSALREAGVVELLAPLLSLDHYQSLKAAMAVTFVCRYDEDYATYDLLRKTENVIPKIINLLSNTLSGRGGNGYKYGVFTLRSSVGCIASLACGPEFMKERIAIRPVFENLLQVVSDFCVDGGNPGAIVGGGRDDPLSATFAIRALNSLTAYLVPIPSSSSLPFGPSMVNSLIQAFDSFEKSSNPSIKNEARLLAADAKYRIQCTKLTALPNMNVSKSTSSLGQALCLLPSCLHDTVDDTNIIVDEPSTPVRTFLLTDDKTGQRFVVPTDPSGGRAFYDDRRWCYRRGRFCKEGETPDPHFQWTTELEAQYALEISKNRSNALMIPPSEKCREKTPEA